MTRPSFPLLCLALASGCGPASTALFPEEEARRVEETAFTLKPGRRLDVETDFGDVRVVVGGSDRTYSEARLVAKGRTKQEAEDLLARARVDVVNDRGDVRIRLVVDPAPSGEPPTSRPGTPGGVAASFRVAVPEGVLVRARSASGAVAVEGAAAGVDASSEFGAVAVDGARGAVQAKTGSGDVALRNLKTERVVAGSKFGAVELRGGEGVAAIKCGSGSIVVAGWKGAVEAETSFGTVAADGVFSRAVLATQSGSARLAARPGSAPTEDWSVRSEFGDVVFEAAAEFGAKVDARTRFGEVRCLFPKAEIERREDRSRFTGVLGGGGRNLKLTSGSGSITLKPLDV